MIKNSYDNKHLTLIARKTIQDMLNDNKKLVEIAKAINKDPRTISKEIYRNRDFIDQANRRRFLTGSSLTIQKPCERIIRFPLVCNGCRKNCTRDHYKYIAESAQRKYTLLLSSAREGIDISPDELPIIDKVVSTGVKNGQSPYAIKENNPDIVKCSVKTLYTYVSNGVFSISDINLRNKVKLKKRKSKYNYDKKNADFECLNGRRIENYFKFVLEHPGINTVQLDTVEGSINSEKCFLTLHFINYHFMLVFLLESKKTEHVISVFNQIEEKVGIENFKKLFPCILTDRGIEFVNAYGIEFSNETGEQRTKVFYCDAYVSNQKAQIESNHRKVRYIVPKGTYMDNLTNDNAKAITSNIASYPVKELSGNTPYEMMFLIYGQDLLTQLEVKKVDRTNVNLTPSLLCQK